MDFLVSNASPEEFRSTTAFLQDYFFDEDPKRTIFGLQQEEAPRIPDCASFIIKADDPRGQLVGVVFCTTEPSVLWEKGKSPKQKQVAEFFEFFEVGCRRRELPLETVHLWFLAVHPQWQKRGVGRALGEATEREARAAGFKAISATCVSEYSARLARSLGFRPRHTLRYMDYPRLSGRDVHLTPCPPHCNITFYVKEL